MINPLIYIALLVGMMGGLAWFFDRLRTKRHKKVLSKKQKRELIT